MPKAKNANLHPRRRGRKGKVSDEFSLDLKAQRDKDVAFLLLYAPKDGLSTRDLGHLAVRKAFENAVKTGKLSKDLVAAWKEILEHTDPKPARDDGGFIKEIRIVRADPKKPYAPERG